MITIVEFNLPQQKQKQIYRTFHHHNAQNVGQNNCLQGQRKGDRD
jgi:hypothetical protein